MIEFAGLPASGKTTLFRDLRAFLKAREFPVLELGQVFDTPYEPRSAPRCIKNDSAREMLFRQLAFKREHPELTNLVEQRLGTPERAIEAFWFWFMAARFQAYAGRRQDDGALILDEGFLQHGTAIFLRDETHAEFDRYLDLIPLPDAVLAIKTTPETAYQRMIDRPKARSLASVHARHGELAVFRHREEMMTRALTRLEDRGAKILDISGEAHEEDAVERIGVRIIALAREAPTHEVANWRDTCRS